MKYRNILIVKLSAIGDVIHALPVARALKQCNADIRITWIAEKPAYDLLTNNPDIDEVIFFDKPKFRSISGFIENVPDVARDLQSRKFDLVLDLQGLFKSALIAWLARAKRAVGYCNMRELSGIVSKPICGAHKTGHVVERYLDVVRGLGCKVDKPEFVIQITVDEIKSTVELLAQHDINMDEKYIVIAPGTNWPTKCWPAEKYGHLAKLLIEEHQCPIVVIGGPNDRELADKIGIAGRNVVDLTGRTTLKQLSYVIRKSALFIGGDTGPMHLAVAVDTPVVALFGPTDPTRNGPYGHNNIVITANKACAPCFKRSCQYAACMCEIKAEQVIYACQRLIGG